MNEPIRVIMPNGTVHTFRLPGDHLLTLAYFATHFSGWARIERVGVKQPPSLIEGDNDG